MKRKNKNDLISEKKTQRSLRRPEKRITARKKYGLKKSNKAA